MATISTVQAPMPGSPARRRAPRPGRIPGRGRAAAVERVDQRGEGPAPTPGQRRIGVEQGGRGREQVGEPAGRVGDRLAVAPHQGPAVVRAAAVETCWPSTARTASSAPSTVRGTRRPGRLGHQRREDRVAPRAPVDRLGVGVEVEQPPAPGDGGGEVGARRRGRPGRRCGRASGSAPRSPGRGRGAACAGRWPRPPPRPRGRRWRPGARRGCRGAAAGGTAGARRAHRRVAARPVRSPCRRARSSVGGRPKTARTVSLNWRMLEKPAAKATSAMGSAVVSISTRAVWARWARARAIGPAPDLGQQQALELADAVAELGGQPGHPGPVDHAVGDEPHGPAHDVGPRRPTRAIPVWRRAGTACRPGSRPAGRRRPSRRSARCHGAGCGPGSSAGSRSRSR